MKGGGARRAHEWALAECDGRRRLFGGREYDYTRVETMLWLLAIAVASIGIPILMRVHSDQEKWRAKEVAWEKRASGLSEEELERNTGVAPLRYAEEEFQELVARALDEIPEEFDKEWENVAVIVSTGAVSDADRKKMKVPDGHLVFGTYTGVDRTQGQWSQASRHVITIYQRALEQKCGADKELLEQEVRRTVLHELAHHLGMSHARMKEIGL